MAELQGELQRITGTNLDEAGAANTWAGTQRLELLGALNAKAGTTGVGLDAVCNLIAGTTNLSGAGALATIPVGGGGSDPGDTYLLEDGDDILLESGDFMLLE
jgi:hypothetical protein